MSKKITYQIEFFSYWHAGSGLAGSTYADSIVNKNEDNLPVIPGKTIKGLLREAAEKINELNKELVSNDFILNVFGEKESTGLIDYKKEGRAFFSNVSLSKSLSENILKSNLSDDLYHVISSTEIDNNGQAKDGSLRQLEVTIPITLYGSIEHFPDNNYEVQLANCFKWIKQLGHNRNRGLGKCKFSIVNN
jgi:CRISPR/Cas system CSM-associated protein Csm3 (group 7 of RAMP superfamily)